MTHPVRMLTLYFKDLVCLSGTIPVPFRGHTYNIPVCVWLLDTHPSHAPMVYVCPTETMQIRVSRHVDHNGKVYLPYLHEWNASNSDLLGLIQVCIVTFSEQSPVFAKQQQQATPPYPPPTTATQPTPPYPTQQSGGSIAEEHIKASLTTAVEEKVRRLLREEFNTKQVELESLRRVKDELSASQSALGANVEAVKAEIINLNRLSEKLTTKKSELEAASSALKATKSSTSDSSHSDDVVYLQYPLYNQLLNAYAEDAAIEDSIYYFGEALRQGAIDCDTFLKASRNISRKQYFLRLTTIKCRAKAGLN